MPRGRPKKAVEASKPEEANGKAMSKMAAMQQAMATLGNDAKPLVIQDHLKKTFKIDMGTNAISSYKTTISRQGKGKGKKSRKKRKKAAAATTNSGASVSSTRAGGGISLDDIRAVKALADRLGAEKVKSLAEVLA